MSSTLAETLRLASGCVTSVALLFVLVAAVLASVRNQREGRPVIGGWLLVLGWAGSLLAGLVFLVMGWLPASAELQGSIWLLASVLNTFMTLVILIGTALLSPRKPEAGSHG